MSVMSRVDQRLTPDLVQSISFRLARLGRRGFDEEHVRAFCRQVEAELVMLLNERTALQEEVGRLRRRVLGMGADETGVGYRREDAHIQAVGILSRAQQTADHYVAEAQEYSRHLAEDARRRRDQILAEARSHADRMMEEAHLEASQAAQTALAAPVMQPETGRKELEAELAYLRTYSDVYRTHLRAYLDALLRNVDEWEHAEKSSLSAVRPSLSRLSPPGVAG
jgi:DivIVA domain-containing protein